MRAPAIFNPDATEQAMSEPVVDHPIILVGKDARTDAIASALLESRNALRLVGLSELEIPGLRAKCSPLLIADNLTDTSWLADVVSQHAPALAVIGPEEPLEAGYADEFERLGVPTFGPRKALAAIESSKSFARRLLDRHDIPGNPESRLFETEDGLASYVRDLDSFVVKPDGLTGGKGVRVQGDHFQTHDEGLAYARQLLASDGRVQIEEKLIGEEFSLQTITDGETVIHCPAVQDHKRAFEGDCGPNTGGMGSYSCPDHSLPFLDDADLAEARAINERVIEVLGSDSGFPYHGVLYGGFIATRDGVKLIEYNCRFGDPEAMNVLPLLQADFVELAYKTAIGRLHEVRAEFAPLATVCKYVVPENYPDRTPAGQRIHVPDDLQAGAGNARWYWAASRQEGDSVTMTGSRAGAVVGIGESVDDAERIAEDAVRRIGGALRHRKDIGTAALVSRRVAHMRELRGARV